ncbi:MAG: hypothetical protein JJW01_01970 [Alphaproteobacteria bacterium]|nr:hypothetical protein [Rickettsiales bacterium]
MGNTIDLILIIGALLSVMAFFLARITSKISLATESMIYSQINIIVIASEVVKYFVLSSDLDYIIVIQRCAFFAIMSTMYFFVAIILQTFSKKEEEYTTSPNEVEVKELMRRFEELRHNIATKLHNMSSKIVDINSNHSSMQKTIDVVMVDMQSVIDRLCTALEVLQSSNTSKSPKKNINKSVDKNVAGKIQKK